MEWRECYLDVILVPLGLMVYASYHVYLWHKLRTQPLTTIIGTNARARRFWVASIIKVTSIFLYKHLHTHKYMILILCI